MSTLENKKISESYKDILQVSNTNTGVDGTMRYIEDGEGTATGIGVSTDSINLSASPTGTITIDGDTTVNGTTTLEAVALSGHVIPTRNAQFDLGSAEYKIRHLFLSDNSIYIGDDPDINNLKRISIENGALLLPNDTKVGEHKLTYSRESEVIDGNNGNDDVGGGAIDDQPKAISVTAQVSLLNATTPVNPANSNKFILPDGEKIGQLKIIAAVILTDDKIEITPTTLMDGNRIIFPIGLGGATQESAGCVTLLWTGPTGWMVINKSSDEILLEA